MCEKKYRRWEWKVTDKRENSVRCDAKSTVLNLDLKRLRSVGPSVGPKKKNTWMSAERRRKHATNAS